MKWLKKWYYLILLVGTGFWYMACVDHWQVYAGALEQVKEWYREVENGNLFMAGADGKPVEEAWSQNGGALEGDGKDGSQGETGGAPGNQYGSNEEAAAGNSVGTGSGNGSGAPGADAGTGSGNNAGTPGADAGTGSGNNAGTPGTDAGTGSGNNAGSPGAGVGTGSGNNAGSPGAGAGTGSGNNAGSPGAGAGTGSGNNAGDSGESGGLPEVQYMTVEDDYFADAVFIGDSRTVGMFEYGGLEETAAFYASTGLTVYKMFEAEIVSVPGERKKITVEEALQQNRFGKIYLMIGINEMGTGTVESFLEKYQEVVGHLQELQPDAIIYLQAIIKVTEERSAQGDYISNEGILARNEGIARMADNEKVFFLDVNPLVCDDTGGMNPDYTFDGVHLKAKYIEIWKDYLKSHAISS